MHSYKNQPGKIPVFLLIAMLLLPLFFINVKDSHNWSGDFALYILQAKNLVEGKPQTTTGYIFNEQCFLPSPQTYPVGFPILLSPFYVLFGNNILAFSYLISFVLFLLGLALYYFFRGHFSPAISGGALLLIVYNPWTLSFKGEILADIPFALFMMLAVIGFEKLDPNRKIFLQSLRLGALVAVTMLMKSVGVVLLFSILADSMLRIVKKMFAGKKNDAGNIVGLLLAAAGSAILFYAAIAFLLIPSAKEPLPYYQSLYSFRDPLNLMVSGLLHYIGEFRGFFYLGGSVGKILAGTTIVLATLLMVIGFFKKCLKSPAMPEWLAATYTFLILAFPTTNQGFRYIFPILPLYIYYTVIGARTLPWPGKIHANHVLALITMLCLLHYPLGILHILRDQDKIAIGPQEKQSQEAFRYIKENTPPDAVIAFRKATVLPLYTDRRSIGSNRPDQNIESLAAKFSQVGVRYYLINAALDDPGLERFLSAYQEKVRMVWTNDKFTLYENIE